MIRPYLSVLAALSLCACSGENRKAELESFAQEGQWTISQLNNSGIDESSYFIDYRFAFESGGTLKATGNSDTISGSWSVAENSGTGNNDLEFTIFTSQNYPWNELNKDWDVRGFSSTQIVLNNENGNGDTDSLTFSK